MPRPKIVLHDPGVVQMFNDVTPYLEGKAEQGAAAARSSAPVVSGAYRDSIHVWTERHGDRNVVHWGAGVDYAMEVEANTGNMSRSLDAAGGG